MSRELKLKVKKYKVPITREGDKIIEEIDLKPEMVVSEEEEIFNEDRPLDVQLPTLTKKVAQFNKRQKSYAEQDDKRDYIFKKIVSR